MADQRPRGKGGMTSAQQRGREQRERAEGERAEEQASASERLRGLTFKTNVLTLSGISRRLQRRTSKISEQRVVSLGLEPWNKQTEINIQEGVQADRQRQTDRRTDWQTRGTDKDSSGQSDTDINTGKIPTIFNNVTQRKRNIKFHTHTRH